MTDQPVDLDTRIGQYVMLRDIIKETEAKHKEELKKPKETLEQLGNLIMEKMDAVGADSVKSQSGTAYFSHKNSATIADGDAFMRHVIGSEAWELIERKASSTAVAKFVEENGTPPPGVNFSRVRTLGVNRPRALPETGK